MRQVKPETIAKKSMQLFIDQFGINDIDCSIISNKHQFMVVAPNRFSHGYIMMIDQVLVWSADFNKSGKIMTPKSRAKV